MRYIEHEFIGYYLVEESDELYSMEDSKIIKKIGNFLMGFGAFGAVFFMNTQKAVAIQAGSSSNIPQAVRDRGKQYVKNKVHILPQEIHYRINAILIENALIQGHQQFYDELKKKSLSQLEVELKIQSGNQFLLQNSMYDGYNRLKGSKILAMESLKLKQGLKLALMQNQVQNQVHLEAQKTAQDELIRNLVKAQINSYLQTFTTYLSYGAGLTVSSLILYQIIQMVRNKQKRKKVLEALIKLRGGASWLNKKTWNRVKDILVNSFTSENTKYSNCNGEKRLSFPIKIGKVMLSQEAAVGMILVLLKVLEKRRIAGIREKNSIDVAYDLFFPKPMLIHKMKKFLPRLDFKTPQPYLIILVGGIVIYYSVIVSSEQKRALFKHLKDELHKNLTSLLYSLDSFIEFLNYYLESDGDDVSDREIELVNFLIARLQANTEKEEAKLRLLYKALNLDKDFKKIKKQK
jgi:hypothetical protein